jgi:hypothetical protein
MANRPEARTEAEPTSLSSGVLARSLWWLAGGATLQGRAGRDPDGLNPGASVATPEQIRSLEQVRDVVSGLLALKLPTRQNDELRYRWIDTSLHALQYRQLARSDRGLVLNYLQRLSGYSRAQVNRLVARWMAGQTLAKQYARPEHAFARRYQAADIALLAEVDSALGRLSGAATASVLRRQREWFGDDRMVSLASISVSQLYLLRRSAEYLAAEQPSEDLVPGRQLTVGSRRAAAAEFRPGQLQVESVHEGHATGSWRVCVMDIATQWRVMIDWPSSPGEHRVPQPKQAALAALVRQLPFAPLEFAAPEGSDPRCRMVAAEIETVRAEARVPQHAFELDPWARFVNLHRPCAFPTEPERDRVAGRGHRVMTPLDRLLGLAAAESWLNPGVSRGMLLEQARAMDALRAAATARAFTATLAVSQKDESRLAPPAA